MSVTNRRFFSGDSLRQALVAAANHFNLDPEEIAYRAIEKRHGFLKSRRKVYIEVDPEAPKRSATTAPPVVAAVPAPAPRAEPRIVPALAAPEAPRPAAPPHVERPERPRGDRDRREPRRGPREGREGRERRGSWEPRGPRPDRGEPREARGPEPPVAPGLIALPDAPRRTSERYPIATGPVAEAAQQALALMLGIAGLELSARIHQGEERLEVELHGEDTDPCFSDGGELLMAIEHLLPRVIRGITGEAVACRVDCDSFHEIREEQLRSLAQSMANEVRRLGRPRTLEPMNPSDRRIVHMTLADDPAVVTESDGQGYFKRITIRPA